MRTGYPAILVLDGRVGVVIGGGAVGERKVRTLLDAGARVRCIALDPSGGVRALAAEGRIELLERAWRRGDLEGVAVAVAATDDPGVNQGVFEEATERGIPVNVVDDVPRCTFIAPSIVRRGDLLVAISTGGKSPALAVRLRERLERELGDEYAVMLALLGDLRDAVTLPGDQAARSRAWYCVVDDEEMWRLVRAGRIGEARDRGAALLTQ